VQAGGTDRNVTISMNKPLRLAGYTFYQHSYEELPGGQAATVLSVVRNYGRAMPYLATGLTSIGMCLHFGGILYARMRKMQAREAAQ
jgi:hypothetical protein